MLSTKLNLTKKTDNHRKHNITGTNIFSFITTNEIFIFIINLIFLHIFYFFKNIYFIYLVNDFILPTLFAIERKVASEDYLIHDL